MYTDFAIPVIDSDKYVVFYPQDEKLINVSIVTDGIETEFDDASEYEIIGIVLNKRREL